MFSNDVTHYSTQTSILNLLLEAENLDYWGKCWHEKKFGWGHGIASF